MFKNKNNNILNIRKFINAIFFYYVTAFCHVYNRTQTSWLLDSLTSYEIALNCFFYLSDNISDKYHYKGKSAILFSLTNNITISLVSSIV